MSLTHLPDGDLLALTECFFLRSQYDLLALGKEVRDRYENTTLVLA